MYFLGISGGVLIGNQDGAAALMKDGKIIAAAEEERFLKVKHAPGRLPRHAIKYCLKQAGISIRDITAVGFAGATYDSFQEILSNYFTFHFGYAPLVYLFDHHTAHAASTFFLSPFCFDKSLIITFDYSGDRASTVVFKAIEGRLHEIMRIHKPNSLGIFYSILTQYLGFEKDTDEYKVMGLSSYGEPRYDMSSILKLKDKAYILNSDILRNIAPNKPAPSKQECIFTKLPLPGKPRLPEEPINQYHKDIAASGQRALENAVLNLVYHAVNDTGIKNLCFAGGVALNCVMNKKVRESGFIDELFVPPHTSDAGLAIGCAILLNNQYQGKMPEPMNNCYWGPEYSEDEIKIVLDRSGVVYDKPSDICKRVAEDIALGKIVGWFQGRMEFGPRALGNRSILADCRRKDMTDKINALVKFREEFRPFAPSVIAPAAKDFFERAAPSPYMTLVFDVKKEKRDIVPAITHVDGTARVHTVEQEVNPLYYKLISIFASITGVPVILNTSLNVQGQPMALEPKDALSIFYSTGMHSLAIGPFYLSKNTIAA
ncbi:MAG: carbamoyl transferase [Clostridia bacterium]|nr:carbamoyl transferase [Clostridia bacterium]